MAAEANLADLALLVAIESAARGEYDERSDLKDKQTIVVLSRLRVSPIEIQSSFYRIDVLAELVTDAADRFFVIALQPRLYQSKARATTPLRAG